MADEHDLRLLLNCLLERLSEVSSEIDSWIVSIQGMCDLFWCTLMLASRK